MNIVNSDVRMLNLFKCTKKLINMSLNEIFKTKKTAQNGSLSTSSEMQNIFSLAKYPCSLPLPSGIEVEILFRLFLRSEKIATDSPTRRGRQKSAIFLMQIYLKEKIVYLSSHWFRVYMTLSFLLAISTPPLRSSYSKQCNEYQSW